MLGLGVPEAAALGLTDTQEQRLGEQEPFLQSLSCQPPDLPPQVSLHPLLSLVQETEKRFFLLVQELTLAGSRARSGHRKTPFCVQLREDISGGLSQNRPRWVAATQPGPPAPNRAGLGKIWPAGWIWPREAAGTPGRLPSSPSRHAETQLAGLPFCFKTGGEEGKF